MWQCPKCNRKFEKQKQQHYCGNKPGTVDDYIQSFDSDVQKQLLLVRQCLQEALPDATEKISWSMPTYWKGHNIIHFAGQKKHIGLYPGTEAVVQFSKELDEYGYKYSKGSKSATTSSTGGLPLALQRAMLLLAPKGGVASFVTGPL